MYTSALECKQFNQVTQQDWTLQGQGKAWVVSLGGEHIDIVWFQAECTADYVRNMLIRQDGYDLKITVTKPS